MKSPGGNRTIFVAPSPYTADALEDFNGQITVAGRMIHGNGSTVLQKSVIQRDVRHVLSASIKIYIYI